MSDPGHEPDKENYKPQHGKQAPWTWGWTWTWPQVDNVDPTKHTYTLPKQRITYVTRPHTAIMCRGAGVNGCVCVLQLKYISI